MLFRALLAAGLVAGGCTPGDSPELARSEQPAVTRPAAATADQGRWRPVDPAPIPPALGMATAWTGTLLVAWGGEASGGDRRAADAGAAYEPAKDRWTVLPRAPIAARSGARAVWTGREVLFWGGRAAGAEAADRAGGPPGDTLFADGAAYEPGTRKWRTLPAAPIAARAGHEAVWTGREMLVWGGYDRCCPLDSVLHDPAAAAYDPTTDRWRLVAPVPPPWSGDDGSAVTVAAGGRPFLWRQGHLGALGALGAGAAGAAGDHWAEVGGAPATPPPAPGEHVFTTTADPLAVGAAAGDEIFVWSGSSGRLSGVAHRPGEPSPGPWRRTATLTAQSGATLAAAGPGRIYAATGQSTTVLEYRVEEDRWRELPPAPITNRSFAALVWTGSELLFWGGVGDEGPEMDGAAWTCC